MADRKPRVSRRTVLKTSGVVAGGLAVGGLASGVAAQPEGQGGTAFVTNNVKSDGKTNLETISNWESFQFVEDDDGNAEEDEYVLYQAPGCTNGQQKLYQGYRVEETDGDGEKTIYLNSERNIEIGVPMTIRSVKEGCVGDADNTDTETKPDNPDLPTAQFSFGPATDN